MTVQPVFFVDRCLGLRVVHALRSAGAKVEAHDDLFAQESADVDWIPVVGEKGWIILTKDKNIRRKLGEREAVMVAKARVFILSSGNMSGRDMATLFVERLADIEAFAMNNPPPFIALLDRTTIKMLRPSPSPDDALSDEPETPPESDAANA